MPYKLRKAPKKDLYWVITIETGKKHSKLPISLEKAKAQMRILESTLEGQGKAITIPRKAFIKEHKNLLKVLASKNPQQLKAEAIDQSKELNKVLSGGISESNFEAFSRQWDKYRISSMLQISPGGNLQFDRDMPPGELLKSHIQAYFSTAEYKQIIKSIPWKNYVSLYEVTHMKEFIEKVKKLYGQRFENLIHRYLTNLTNLSNNKDYKERVKLHLNLLEFIGNDINDDLITMEFHPLIVYKEDLEKRRKEFPPVKRGGISEPNYIKFSNIVNDIFEDHEGKNIYRMLFHSDGTIERESESEKEGMSYIEVLKSAIKAYFSTAEYNQIIKSIPWKNFVSVFNSKSIQEVVELVKKLYGNKFKSLINHYGKLISDLDFSDEKRLIYYGDLYESLFYEIFIIFQEFELIPLIVTREKLEKDKKEFPQVEPKRGQGHTDQLKRAYMEHLRTANPQQRINLTEIYDTARRRIKEIGPSRPFLRRIRGQPAHEHRAFMKEQYVRNALFDMRLIMNPDQFENPIFNIPEPIQPIESIPPNLEPVDPGTEFNQDCPICLEHINDEDKHIAPCGHVFDEQCYNQVRPIDPVTGLRKCPICRKGMGNCKNPAPFYSKGKASVFALTCIDPRYAFDVAYFLQHKKELHQDYDLFTSAGASVGAQKKEWTKAFFDNLELGIKLHGISEVWCFDHLDCGMYKATFGLTKDDDPKIHIVEMDKLAKLIKKKHPKLKFRKFLVDAQGYIHEK